MPILLEILAVALLALLASRFVPQPWRGRLYDAIKVYLTIRMVWLLLEWPVKDDDGQVVAAWRLVVDVVRGIEADTFWTFALVGAGVRFTGVLFSMLRWHLVLLGQGIRFPFRHVFGAFLIGRAIGFFLPSTAGLDAYKLYDAARFSGRTVEVTAGTALEKVLGVSGIFLTFLVALPFGYSIFGERAGMVAAITVPLATGVIAGLLLVLWFPGIVQWGIRNVPLPGKARLSGLVTRISNAAAAYRDKKLLVLGLLFCSFAVHFTTAAMYYFMALAIGAGAKAAFWPVVFGSSIQIFATVIGPTIGGLGVREAAQLLTIGSLIGPGAAIVSATIGFWVGEVPTLFGFVYWILRGRDYRPASCLVDGQQVDYDEAAKAAASLEDPTAPGERPGSLPPLAARARLSGGLGLGAGLGGGLLVGIVESVVVVLGGIGGEAQVVWSGPVTDALVFGAIGLGVGLALAVLPMDEEEARGWTPALALIATVVPVGLFITFFRVRRDLYLEQMPPMPVLLGILAAFGALALLLFLAGPGLLRGPLARVVRPGTALLAVALVGLGSAFTARSLVPGDASPAPPPAVPAALAERPNVILVMVDTLRADHLSCYGGPVPTPAMCSLAEDGGSRFAGFTHASWTKPSTATLLTSLLPSSHGVMSKPAALPEDAVMISEVLQDHGYATGGIVSNINLAPSFGFEQGYDEYHYLGPDYLFGARESSSRLILYQIARRIWFKLSPGLRVGDFYQSAETVNAVAFDFLDRHRDARFFLFLHYMDPHDPYFEHPWDGTGIARAANQHPDPARAGEMQRLYREEIAYLDDRFAEFLERLRERGVYDDTVIALVSDHGEEFQEHGGWWHGTTLFEEQIGVPFLVKWAAGGERPDAEPGALARILDVAPTLVARTGAPVPDTMQGIDLVAHAGSRSERERMVFAEEDHEGNVLRALRTEHWKLIEANPGNPRGLPERQLFNVAKDPGETEDVLDRASWVVQELRDHADAHEQLAESRSLEGGSAARLSAADEEALRQLGYIE